MSVPNSQEQIDEKISLVMEFGSALHHFGAPSHRLEGVLNKISDRLDMPGQFFCTPTAIMASFATSKGRRPSMTRLQPGSIELEKMILTSELGSDLINEKVSVKEAAKQLQEIVDKPNGYSIYANILSFGLISASASILLGGAYVELVISLLLGLVIGAFAIFAGLNQRVDRIFEAAAAFLAFLLAALIFAIYPQFSTQIVVISSLIVLVPGLSLTIAMEELSTMNLVSGTARLMHALILFFKIGFGIVLANQVVNWLLPNLGDFTLQADVPRYISWIALVVAPMAFTVLFKARVKDSFWIFLACLIGFVSSKTATGCFGIEMGAFIGGFFVGIASNLYSRTFDKPATVTLLPGILLLVPGSIGFKGIRSMLQQDTLTGLDLSFDMFVMAVALVAGILLANIFVPSKRYL